MSEPFERLGMRTLTYEEVVKAFMELPVRFWQVTPPNTPDRHKDYLPLNKWDETQDE